MAALRELSVSSQGPQRARFSILKRVQCGDHYTVASTNQNEIYYWGLRFKDPSIVSTTDDLDSRSSVAGGSKDDMRVESVTPRNTDQTPRNTDQTPRNTDQTPRNTDQTPRNTDQTPRNADQSPGKGGHSRQLSTTSGISIPSVDDSSLTDKELEGYPSRQESVETNESTVDSGFTGDDINNTDISTRPGFRPLSSVPKRSTSASSRENTKEKDGDNIPRDDSEIIYPPDHLMRIKSTEELLTLISFFCHGENIFVQVETTAPPLRKKSRKKRGIRKRYSGSTLPVPNTNTGTSASSREGGDECSSETSELDSQGTVPTWIRKELELTKLDVPGNIRLTPDLHGDDSDGNLADDTSDQSDEDRKHATIDSSMSSIQINRDLTPCKLPPDKNLTPRNSDVKASSVKKNSPREVRTRSFSNSTESEIEVSNQSDSSSKDLKLTSRSKTELNNIGSRSCRKPVTNPAFRVKSAASSTTQWAHNRLRPGRGYVRQDVALTEQLAARGFVSDVTVKRREEALLGELQMTREEKKLAEQRLQELEHEQLQRQEQFRMEAEQRALEREKELKGQIELLKMELQSQNSQLQDNQKIVMSLQDQLSKIQNKKKNLGANRIGGSSESKVCVLQ